MTILVDDFIPTDEEQGISGAVCSSIYAVKFGRQGLMGLENGGVQVERVGELETKDATRTRVNWYCGLRHGVRTARHHVGDITHQPM